MKSTTKKRAAKPAIPFGYMIIANKWKVGEGPQVQDISGDVEWQGCWVYASQRDAHTVAFCSGHEIGSYRLRPVYLGDPIPTEPMSGMEPMRREDAENTKARQRQWWEDEKKRKAAAEKEAAKVAKKSARKGGKAVKS